jgi:hypothetical protein
MEFAGGGAVKVNNVYPGRPQGLPLQCYLRRVTREYRFLLIVTLVEADAPAFSDV